MRNFVAILLLSLAASGFAAQPRMAASLFAGAKEAYRVGDYTSAALLFREAALKQPASGTLQNLGVAEWQRGQTGPAVLAWEQALWLKPFNPPVRENLRFARRVAQLESPELTWYEVVSSWLPVNWWVWLAGLSFWTAVAAATLPGILRLRKAVWQQALAAAGMAVFLLSVPAHLGIESRSRLGFVLQKDAGLRLTPTEHSQLITRLPAGEAARVKRVHGRYLLIRTSRGQGWMDKQQFGLISPRP